MFARRARLDDTARRCYAALERRDPETAAWVRAYVEGVNEGLGEGGAAAPEFAATGLAPGHLDTLAALMGVLAEYVLPEIDLPDVYLPEKRAQLAFLPRQVAFPG